jgi:transcription elongation factor GreA
MQPARTSLPSAPAAPVGGARLGLVVGASEYAAHERELDRLRTLRARDLADRLRRARGFVASDAAEEIAQAQDDQNVLDARIARLDELLRTATIVPDDLAGDAASLGWTVEVEYEGTGRRATYRLDGIAAGGPGRSVSARSPVGRAVMGRRAGDAVSVELPAGRVERLRIVAIAPPAP